MASNADGTIKLNLSVGIDDKSVDASIRDLSKSLKANIKGATDEASHYIQALFSEMDNLSKSTQEKLAKGYKSAYETLTGTGSYGSVAETNTASVSKIAEQVEYIKVTSEQTSEFIHNMAMSFAMISVDQLYNILGVMGRIGPMAEYITMRLSEMVGGAENFAHILNLMQFTSQNQLSDFGSNMFGEVGDAIDTTFRELQEFTGGIQVADQAFKLTLDNLGAGFSNVNSMIADVVNSTRQLPALIQEVNLDGIFNNVSPEVIDQFRQFASAFNYYIVQLPDQERAVIDEIMSHVEEVSTFTQQRIAEVTSAFGQGTQDVSESLQLLSNADEYNQKTEYTKALLEEIASSLTYVDEGMRQSVMDSEDLVTEMMAVRGMFDTVSGLVDTIRTSFDDLGGADFATNISNEITTLWNRADELASKMEEITVTDQGHRVVDPTLLEEYQLIQQLHEARVQYYLLSGDYRKNQVIESGAVPGTQEWENYQAEIQKAADAVTDLEKKLQEFRNPSKPIEIIDEKEYEKAKRIQEIEEQIHQKEQEREQLLARQVANKKQGNIAGTRAYEDTSKEINQVNSEIEELQNELNQLNGSIETSGEELGSFASQMFKVMKEFATNLQKMGAFGPDVLDMSYKLWAGFDEAFDKINSGMNNLFQIPDSLGDAISQGLGDSATLIEEFGLKCEEVINNVDKEFEDGFRGIGDMAKEYGGFYGQIIGYVIDMIADKVNQIQAIFGKAASATGKYIASILRTGQGLIGLLQQVIDKAKTLGGKIIDIFKGIDKKMPNAKKILNMILRYGIGIRSVYMLFRKFKQMIQEGFKSMALFSERTNKALSTITSNWNQLKGQISASFEPILVTLEPILTRIIQLLTEATLRVTKFIGALAGTKQVLKATLIYKDYADSIGNANKQLAGFDELNNLTSNSGSGADKNLNGWEWVDSEFPSWWESFQAQWESGDLTQFGNDVADKIIEMLNSIPWFKIQSAATDMGKRLATFLNGFLSPDFGTEIGETIANAFTVAIDFVNKFLTTLDFGNVGDTLASAVNSFVETIDFERVRNILETGFTGLLEAVTHFRDSLDVDTILTALDTLLTIDTDDISDKIANLINSFIGEPEQWEQGGKLIKKFISNIIQTLKKSATKVNWSDLFENVREWVDGIDFVGLGEELGSALVAMAESIDANDLALTIRHLLTNVMNGVLSFLNELDSSEIETWLTEFFESIDLDSLISQFTDIINRITELIPWSTIGTTIGKHLPALISSFISVGKNLFGGMVSGIVAFLLNFISEIWAKINPVAILTKCAEFAASLVMTIVNKIREGKDNVVNALDVLKAWVLGVFSDIRDKAYDKMLAMKEKLVSVFNALKNALKTPINGIITFINGLIKGVTTGINKVIDSLNGLTISPPSWMVDAASALGINLGDVNFNIPKIPSYTIPALAQGAVLPPNKPFLAQLGDQKNGTNIETPLATMLDAFNMAFAQNNDNEQMMMLMQQQIQLLQIIAEKEFGITNKQIFSSVQTSAKEFKDRTGRLAFN